MLFFKVRFLAVVVINILLKKGILFFFVSLFLKYSKITSASIPSSQKSKEKRSSVFDKEFFIQFSECFNSLVAF